MFDTALLAMVAALGNSESLSSRCLLLFFSRLQVYKIMKEHKNPKVLSEGILWMVSAVDDFGVSHLKLKVYI